MRPFRHAPRGWPGGLWSAAAALMLLYPLAGLFVPVGTWRWDDGGSTLAAVRVSLELTLLAMAVVVAVGTPMAIYIARRPPSERAWWQMILLISVLLPPLALGILLSLAFGPQTPAGQWLAQAGVRTSNSVPAFVVTQVYVSLGYYVLGAVSAIERVPRSLEIHAALLGHGSWSIFRRITFPLARLGLAVALSLAWVRALGEFGAVMITAYYPAGIPVQLWVDLQNFGLPSVLPLLVVFLVAALPLPWLLHVLAQRQSSPTAEHA
ncbi:MAG TPA: ABC transporter permease subunit [Candidatus Dormibacteraeota bacterium]|nr:ABC transporter permease subunit [Candidatus Dormibacteraeota bacterium]